MKLLVVDDHAVVREGVVALLGQGTEATTVLTAHDAASALAAADANSDLDAVLLDLRLPGVGGEELLRMLGARHPLLPVLVLSSSEDPADVRAAIDAGALGYVAKSAPPAVLLAALDLALAGEIYMPAFAVRAPVPVGGHALTDRQAQVLDLIAANLSNKQIAHRLSVSEKTVKAHITALLRALGASDRREAARLARSR